MFETVEKFSVVKTLQAIEESNVAVLLLDASTEIAEQDAHIAGYILERGRALVMAVNKWDAVRAEQREQIKREMRRKLHFLDWASLHFVSALRRTGLQSLMRSVVAAEQAAFSRLLHAPLDPCVAGRGRTRRTAACRQSASQAALCPPGRLQPAHHRDSRQCRCATCRTVTAVTWKDGFASSSSCRVPLCGSNSEAGSIPT